MLPFLANAGTTFVTVGMHQWDFFSPDTNADTWALGIGRYRVAN